MLTFRDASDLSFIVHVLPHPDTTPMIQHYIRTNPSTHGQLRLLAFTRTWYAGLIWPSLTSSNPYYESAPTCMWCEQQLHTTGSITNDKEGTRDSLALYLPGTSLKLNGNVGSCISLPDQKRRIPTSNNLAPLLMVYRTLTMVAQKPPWCCAHTNIIQSVLK